MKWLRILLVISGTLCLIVGFMPWREATTKTLADGAVESSMRFTLGIPSSPFLLIEQSETKPGPGVVRPDGAIVHKGGGFHSGSSIEFISWSMLSLVLGALLIEVAKRWGRVRDSEARPERQ